jgi:two-component system, chemotaxis family, CheB/CheR fusion protein
MSVGASKAELRRLNEQLLLSALRQQELAEALEDKRAELAVVLASIGDAVLVVDRAGETVHSNAAYAHMSGGTAASLVPEDAQGAPLPPERTPQARAARGEVFSMEFTLPATDPQGPRRWYEANGQPLGPNGSTRGHAVVVIRDITLSTQHRRLQDEFLALASHELRTPLTSIQGYLELLQERLAEIPQADERLVLCATHAQYQGRRLVALVGDLMDASRAQSGKLSLHLVPLEAGALAAQAYATARGIAHTLGQERTITLERPPGALWVLGDAGRLEQVLLNLLTNALTHTPPQAPITVRVQRVASDLALSVQDKGPGIAADQLASLFARFYQAPPLGPEGLHPGPGGLGLGLFICHELTIAHGGRLDVQSTVGSGSTFTVCLPLLRADEP